MVAAAEAVDRKVEEAVDWKVAEEAVDYYPGAACHHREDLRAEEERLQQKQVPSQVRLREQ